MKFEIVLSIPGFLGVSFRSTHLVRDELQQTAKDKPSAIQADLDTNLGVLFNLRSMTIAQIPITDVNNLRLIRMHEIYLREWTAGNFVSLPSQYPTPGGFPMWDIDRTSTSVGVILSATPKVCFSKHALGFGSQLSVPLNWNAGDRRIMSPTTHADSTVATRYNNPTAG